MHDKIPRHIPKIHTFVPSLFHAAIKSNKDTATPSKYIVITIYSLLIDIMYESMHLYN